MASTDYKNVHSSDSLLQNLSDSAERMAKICNDAFNLKKERSEFISATEHKKSCVSNVKRKSFTGDIGELASVTRTKLESMPSSSFPSSAFQGFDQNKVRAFFTSLNKTEGKFILS